MVIFITYPAPGTSSARTKYSVTHQISMYQALEAGNACSEYAHHSLVTKQVVAMEHTKS